MLNQLARQGWRLHGGVTIQLDGPRGSFDQRSVMRIRNHSGRMIIAERGMKPVRKAAIFIWRRALDAGFKQPPTAADKAFHLVGGGIGENLETNKVRFIKSFGCIHSDDVDYVLRAWKSPNDPKLSDRGGRRGTCMVGGKAAAEAGAVTPGAVRCSAWLGVIRAASKKLPPVAGEVCVVLVTKRVAKRSVRAADGTSALNSGELLLNPLL